MSRLLAGTVFDRPPHCERCDLPEDDCRCPAPAVELPCYLAPEKQTAQLSVEKRKRGKTVTVIRGLSATDNDLPELLKNLKSLCGAGGSLKDELLELQGKQLDRLRAELKRIGYRVKG